MRKKKIKKEVDGAILNEKSFKNGLSEAVYNFGNSQFSMGTQLSQVDTMFRNNRWYLVSNMRQLLSEIYVELGIVQTLVDVPVNDGLRGGVQFKSKQLSDQEIEKLQWFMDRRNDLETAGQAAKWNRLFGGAGVVIMTGQDPEMPLRLEAVGKDDEVEFRAVDMWELFWSKQNTSDYSRSIDGADIIDPEFYDYYGVKMHNSHVMKLVGLTAPSFIRPRLRGWGVSIVEAMIRSINQYLKTTDLTFEVLDEFKLDIFKIKNLASTLMTPQGADRVRQRIEIANYQKNYQNALTMDTEDDYMQKQLSFAGISEVMTGIRMQIASDMRMPLTKVFGISAAGFSSGEDDIENYNAMVESQVRGKLKWNILRMAEIRCQQLYGFVPEDLEAEFQPLRMLGAEAQENVKTQKFNRLMQAKTAGEVTTKEFRDAVNKDNLLPIKLDVSDALIDEVDTAKVESKQESKKAPESTTTAKEAKEAKA